MDNVRWLLLMLGRMDYDDVLVSRKWRVEYLYLSRGLPHYRVFCNGELVGVVDVRSPSRLPHVRCELAAYLAGIGCTRDNTLRFESVATTPLDAPKRDLPRLFPKSPDKWKRRKKALEPA